MHYYFVTFIILAITLWPASAPAWNSYGHMSVAYVAYHKLTPQTRQKADALLAKNPDYHNWLAHIPAGVTPAQTNLMVFMIAATWPDRIKGFSSYTEDNSTDPNKCGPLSDQNVGFTDHLRHKCWHFIDVAFSQDGTTDRPPTPTVNAQERVDLFRPVLTSGSGDLKAYDLSWMLHLVGDLHQPLHCTTRVSQGNKSGDSGGNSVQVETVDGLKEKLHHFWDGLLGPDTATPEEVIQTAKKLKAADATHASDLNTTHWVEEGMEHAKDSVYAGPIGPGLGPFILTPSYAKSAKALAKRQVALGGARLGNLLNTYLK